MYWETLLKEVLDKANNAKVIASYGEVESAGIGNQERREAKKFFLGKEDQGIYFTAREAEVMIKLLQGKTLNIAAYELNLSPRTVEFYVKNMKTKLACRTKSELIGRVFASDFIKNVDFITVILNRMENQE